MQTLKNDQLFVKNILTEHCYKKNGNIEKGSEIMLLWGNINKYTGIEGL